MFQMVVQHKTETDASKNGSKNGKNGAKQKREMRKLHPKWRRRLRTRVVRRVRDDFALALPGAQPGAELTAEVAGPFCLSALVNYPPVDGKTTCELTAVRWPDDSSEDSIVAPSQLDTRCTY